MEEAQWEQDREAVAALDGAEAEDSVRRSIRAPYQHGKTTWNQIAVPPRMVLVSLDVDADSETCFERPVFRVG